MNEPKNDVSRRVEILTSAEQQRGNRKKPVVFHIGDFVVPNKEWYTLESAHPDQTGHIPKRNYTIAALHSSRYEPLPEPYLTAILDSGEELALKYLNLVRQRQRKPAQIAEPLVLDSLLGSLGA